MPHDTAPTKRVLALCVRQPWAWAIVHGHKIVENRSWDTKVRGRILIHASKGCTAGEYTKAAEEIRALCGARVPPLSDLPRGGIVGEATLTRVLSPIGYPKYPRGAEKWHCPADFGFLLAKAKPLKFKPMPGKLNFFPVD